MRFSEFDFDVITTPADEVKPPPKRGNADPPPEQQRGDPEAAGPPAGRTPG